MISRISRSSILLVAALILLSLPAIQPFLLDELPRTDDGRLHLYRSIALEHSIRVDGAIWPRYSSGLVYGYGAPLFNYFPPTSYYPMVLLQSLGVTPVTAWLWTMVLYSLMAALGAYLLGRIWSDYRGGLITALAYLYAPYFLFDTITRGTSSEVAALAALPWVLWAFTRLAQRGSRMDFLVATLSLAIFVPIHNIVTLHSAVLIGAMCLYLWLSAEAKLRVFGQMLLAGLLAFVMTSFFWLPALGETSAVKINQVAENLPSVDVTRYLRPLDEIFALPLQADPTQLQPPTPIVLGWPVLLAGIAALLLVWQQPGRMRWLVLTLAGVTLLFVFMNTAPSAELWRNLPLLSYSQFAWRTLGIPSLTLALLSGLTLSWTLQNIRSKTAQTGLFCVFMAIIVAYGVPWLYTPYIAIDANSIQDTQEYERQSGELTLSSYSEYLPIWNTTPPDAEALKSAFEADDVIARLNPPEGVTILAQDWRGTSATIRLGSDDPANLVFDWLYTPGWTARLQDAEFQDLPLSVKPTGPEGFISVEVPAGEYTLEIRLDDTPLQGAGNLLSLFASGLLILGLAASPARIWPKTDAQAATAPTEETSQYRWFVVAGAMGLLLFGFKTLFVDQTQNPFRSERFSGAAASEVDQSVNAAFNGGIRLLGVELPKSAESGATAPLSLFWGLSDGPLDTDYSSLIELRDSQGLIVATTGSFQPGELATSNWLPGYYLHERLNFDVPPYTPPGSYTLTAGLYEPESLQQLSWLNEAGNPVDVKATIGEIDIERPSEQAAEAPALIDTLGALSLLEITGLPDSGQTGDEFILTWLWQSDIAPGSYRARLIWANEDEHISGPDADLVNDFPTEGWEAGEIWRGRHRAYVPADLSQGEYSIGIELLDESGQSAGILSSEQRVMVSVPDRTYELPETALAIEGSWENGIRLAGYEVNQTVSLLTLYWQTESSLSESLRLFVHALQGDQIIAQTDGIPADWTRPTSGWTQGEIITTTHQFDLNEGTYALRVGWYNPLTSERTVLADAAGDALDLPASLIVSN